MSKFFLWRKSGSNPPNSDQDHIYTFIGAFESETASVLKETSLKREFLVLNVLVFLVVLLLVLAAFVKLDRVISATGLVVAKDGPIYISPLDTGIVKKVNVRAGDIVKKGQPLATLDPTFVAADLLQIKQQYASDKALVNRLEAELGNKKYEPQNIDNSSSLQLQIWEKRRLEYRSNVADINGKIQSARAQAKQYERSALEYQKRLKLADEVAALYEPLLEKGFVSKLQVMQAVDDSTEKMRLFEDAKNQMTSFKQTTVSLEGQLNAYIQKWQSDVGKELSSTRDLLAQTEQKLEKTKKLTELSVLESPADAVVLKIGKVSMGAVATGGSAQEPLFTLVTLDGILNAEVHVKAADIGFIKVGDPVDIKLDAYRYTQHGTAKGAILSISEGSFTKDANESPTEPYFKVIVGFKEVNLRAVPSDFRLIPGMTLVGDIMVGRRTILSYLIEGVIKTGTEAMREPN